MTTLEMADWPVIWRENVWVSAATTSMRLVSVRCCFSLPLDTVVVVRYWSRRPVTRKLKSNSATIELIPLDEQAKSSGGGEIVASVAC